MITAQRIAHGEFAAGATVVRVVSRCCGACSAPHCWRCRGAAHMWRIRRQPDLVQCLGRRHLVGCPAWPIVPAVPLFVPLSAYPARWRLARYLRCAFAGRFVQRLQRRFVVIVVVCNVQRAVCHLPPARCKQLRSAIFVCVFKFFINPKNNDRNFRLVTALPSCCTLQHLAHTHTVATPTHTYTAATPTHTLTYTRNMQTIFN